MEHLWLSNELLVAGTRAGKVTVVQQNEQRFTHLSTAGQPIVGLVELEDAFATVSASLVVSVFSVWFHAKTCKVSIRFQRSLVLLGQAGLRSLARFPHTNTLFLART